MKNKIQNNWPHSMYFSMDGTALFITDGKTFVDKYGVSTPWPCLTTFFIERKKIISLEQKIKAIFKRK